MAHWRLAIAAAILSVALFAGDAGHSQSAVADFQAQGTSTDILGDANCSGAVDSIDALAVLRAGAGLGQPACLMPAGDTNCDGAANSVDALRILRFVASLTNPVPSGCVPVGSSMGPPVSSFQLIDEAFEAHEIDLGTALLYKAYAAFQDARLPDEYQGNDSQIQENPFLSALPAAWDSLSQEKQDSLTPFLLPPNVPGSWYEQQQAGATFASAPSDWASLESATLPVKVWYHPSQAGHGAKAAAYLAALEDKIWDRLTGLMGKTPLPDCGASCPSGGGDDRFDIYVVDPSIRSYVSWNPVKPPDCSKTPSFMVLGAGDSNPILAHEFMHAVQFAFDGPADCWEYGWFREASAQWAMDYVYKDDNEEQEMTYSFLSIPERSLDMRNDSHEYGAYLYPFFLVRKFNRPQIVRDIWKTAEDAKVASLAAINQVTAAYGGFETLWPQFTLLNWNTEPVDDYKQWDSLTDRASAYQATLGTGRETLLKNVDYLGAVYYSWTFTNEARSVAFTNYLKGREHAKVWAIVSIDGSWQEPEEWTQESKKNFCRDLPGQNIDRLVIIISNTDWETKQALTMGFDAPVLVISPDTCKAFEGRASTTFTTHDGEIVGRASTENVYFEYDSESEEVPGSDYSTVDGTVTWTYEGTGGNCTISGGGSFAVDNAEGMIHITDPYENGDRQYYAVGGRPIDQEPPTATQYCPDYPPQEIYPLFDYIWLRASISNNHLVAEDGHLRGSEEITYAGGNHQTWEWDLAPAP
ncbi:MAG TPA: dockerin type I repeat-containing protein [Dehalococcoidia bacterium]|nr:dockerin type I repeat-containing protein [Dehalococcoidia bacterium]